MCEMDWYVYLLLPLVGLGIIGLAVLEIKEGKEIFTAYFTRRETDKWSNPVFFWFAIILKIIIGIGFLFGGLFLS